MGWREVARRERQARETSRLDRALARIGPGGCPWCSAALFSDWDYPRDRPFVDAVHDRRCLGPSSRWHRRVASEWLLAQLKVHGYGVSDYAVGDNDDYDHLARHRTVRAPA